MTFTLDLMPGLRSGTGSTPADGGCVIQVASYLWNKEWRDDTPCVHDVLRSVAIWVNDEVDDETRQKLYPLIPRLMGTAIADPVEDERVRLGILNWAAKDALLGLADALRAVDATTYAEPIEKAVAEGDWAEAARAARAAEAAEAARAAEAAWAAEAAEAARAAWAAEAARAAWAAWAARAARAARAAWAARAARAAWAARAAARLDFLVVLLDEFDRLTGRTEPHPVTVADWKTVEKVMAQS
jgi:hypothetical protein